MAKIKAVRKEELYRTYTADSLYFITHYCGVDNWERYSKLLYPEPEDDRNPEDIARDRLNKLGIEVVN